MRREKAYEELTFADNYMFCKILSTNKDLCKALIEMLLDIKVKDIGYPVYEKTIEGLGDSHGIRLDVYVDDDCGTIYDLEMQTTLSWDLGKRSRYYQDMIDMDLLEKGKKYKELNKTYIVFICLTDPFDRGLARYVFRNTCIQDSSLELGDESDKVFINANGSRDNISDELASFLDMLRGIAPAKDSLAENIEKAVLTAKQYNRWKEEYKSMINWADELADRVREEAKAEGLAEGRAEGLAEGRAEGKAEGKAENMINTVRRLLLKDYSDDEIMDITECSVEMLERIKKELNS